MDQPTQPVSVPAARSTLRILTFLATQRGPIPAATIAQHIGIPRSTTYRLLGVLDELGYVLHYPESHRYGIGVAAFELSSGYSRQEPLTRLGSPIIAALVDKIGESAQLAVLHGRDVLYLVEERAPRRPTLVSDVGVRLPSHLTASGRALLATLPPAQLKALFPNKAAFTHRTDDDITSFAALTRVLDEVRERGYAAEDGDVTPGMASVAVAVRDHAGWPAAGIAVTFFAESVTDQRRAELAAEVQFYAAELSRRIRGRSD